MIFKKILLLSIFVLLLSISAVAAEEVDIDNSTNIQNTINQVNSNDTINLNTGTYRESGIEINKSLTIQGKGNPDEVIIDGENKDGILLASSVKLTIRNITFTNALKEGNGGAICLLNGGELIIENCRFIDNNVTYTNESETTNGGAIYAEGTLSTDVTSKITNCIFINNYAIGNGGAVYSKFGTGYMDNCLFENNNASHDGGAIFTEGTTAKRDTTTITNCNFIKNRAMEDGGAINTKFGTYNIDNCLFDKNYARRDGGAVSTRKHSNVNMANSNLTNNYAGDWAGAVHNWQSAHIITNCEIINNSAGDCAGAISIYGSLTQVTYCKIINNSAQTKGGAVHIRQVVDNMPPNVIFNYNEIIGNSAPQGSLVYILQYTEGKFDFNNTYWGGLTPNSKEWSNEFYTNGICGNPTTWLELAENTIKCSDIKRGYNSNYDFEATFLDKFGLPLKNTKVSFKLNNKTYEVTTDSNGVGKIVLKLNPGKYLITSINPVTGEESIKTATIVKRITGNSNLNKDYLQATFKVRVVGDDGNFVGAGQFVTFKIGKTIVKVKTDSKGYASLKITNTPGKYSIVTTYKGESVKNTVTIKRILKASNLSKKKAKKIKYSAKLTGKNIKKKKIIFRIKGKNYSAKTNSKGIATVTLKNLKVGKYKITIKYEKDSIKKTIKIK